MKYELIQPTKIYVAKSEIGGRGVFASEDLKSGELIEECHFIISGCPKNLQDKELCRYVFSIFADPKLSPEENENLSFKINFLGIFEDEGLQEELKNYIKDFGYKGIEDLYNSATVLGNGMIYNHSETNNIDFTCNFKDFMFKYTTNKNIEKDEELFINYGAQYKFN